MRILFGCYTLYNHWITSKIKNRNQNKHWVRLTLIGVKSLHESVSSVNLDELTVAFISIDMSIKMVKQINVRINIVLSKKKWSSRSIALWSSRSCSIHRHVYEKGQTQSIHWLILTNQKINENRNKINFQKTFDTIKTFPFPHVFHLVR